MRTSRLPLLALLALGLAAGLGGGPARAGDDSPAYGAADLALESEGVPAPWEIVYEDVPGTPGEALGDFVKGVAGPLGIEEGDLVLETRILKNQDGTGATLLLVEVDADASKLLPALEEKGKAAGHAVKAMGHPTRILVLASAPAVQKSLVDLQVAYAVRTLSQMAWDRIEAGSRVGAVDLAKGAKSIDPKAGPPMVALGMAATLQELWDEGIEAFRAGFGPGTTVKPEGRFAMRGYAHYGYACLQKKTAEYDREGRDALAKCVALESNANEDDPTFIQRYNLSCAHARLKEKAEALKQLEAALGLAKKKFGPEQLKVWVEGHVLKDEDFAGLVNDPDFKEALKRATGSESGGPEEGL